MKKKNQLIKTGIFLIFLSVALHGLHFLLFKDLKHIFVYLLGDIAFIPLEVFIVSIVIDQLLEKREKDEHHRKLNMLIGLFYQELGMRLLKLFAKSDTAYDSLKGQCGITVQWKQKDFKALEAIIQASPRKINIDHVDLNHLGMLLNENKPLMINLIANPSLLEHETFSELLLAVSHLQEELALRQHVQSEHPHYDNLSHLKIDIERAYGCVLIQWVSYVEHLKTDYPFLFATALLTNPYDEKEIHLIER